MSTQQHTVSLNLTDYQGRPLRAELEVEVVPPRPGRFNPRDGGREPESGEVCYRRVAWVVCGWPMSTGRIQQLLVDWKGEGVSSDDAILELDELVLGAVC